MSGLYEVAKFVWEGLLPHNLTNIIGGPPTPLPLIIVPHLNVCSIRQ